MPFRAHFFVAGDPVPKGSKKGFIYVSGPLGKAMVFRLDPTVIEERIGSSWEAKVIVADDNDGATKKWERTIKGVASGFAPDAPLTGAVMLSCRFLFARPKSVSVKKRPHHTVAPDRDKCLRAVQDALHGIIYANDAQVIEGPTSKRYADGEDERPGVYILVEEVASPESAQGELPC